MFTNHQPFFSHISVMSFATRRKTGGRRQKKGASTMDYQGVDRTVWSLVTERAIVAAIYILMIAVMHSDLRIIYIYNRYLSMKVCMATDPESCVIAT